ncbi:hypothetical protein VNO77_22621 [Canavalia gladiata]|uniref:Uncharacterized protein n=1 Tax=Canavalia gladiata TaxID=3824 RepID=A0AAN9L339_CANGL
MLEATTPATPNDHKAIHKSSGSINAHATLITSGRFQTIFIAFCRTNMVNGRLSITNTTYKNYKAAPIAKATPPEYLISLETQDTNDSKISGEYVNRNLHHLSSLGTQQQQPTLSKNSSNSSNSSVERLVLVCLVFPLLCESLSQVSSANQWLSPMQQYHAFRLTSLAMHVLIAPIRIQQIFTSNQGVEQFAKDIRPICLVLVTFILIQESYDLDRAYSNRASSMLPSPIEIGEGFWKTTEREL